MINLRMPHYFALGLLFFVLVTGRGLLSEGFHPDDWMHAAGYTGRWLVSEGRWFQDTIFRSLLGGEFRLTLQIALAAICFLTICWRLAGHITEKHLQGIAALALLLAGVNHVYLTEAMTWQAHVFSYPLALLMSLVAFELIARSAKDRFRLEVFLRLVLAAQLLALSFAVFQAFAIFGAILPIMMLLRWDRDPLALVARVFLYCCVAGVASILLYAIEWQIIARIHDLQLTAERFGLITFPELLNKFSQIDGFLRNIYSGKVISVPRPARLALLLVAFAGLALPVLAAAMAIITGTMPLSRRLEIVFRVAVSLLLAFGIAPLLFWYVTPGEYFPPRAIGYIGFWMAALTLTGAVQGWSLPQRSWFSRLFPVSAAIALLLAAVVHNTLSIWIWRDRAELASKDLVLAEEIFVAVNQLDQPWNSVKIVGNLPDDWNTFSWRSYMGSSAFELRNPQKSLFEVQYSPDIVVEGAYYSPKACPAFPDPRSVFVVKDIAYVCLEAMPAFSEPQTCLQLSDGHSIAVCYEAPYVLVRFPTCPDEASDIYYLLEWIDQSTGRRDVLGTIYPPQFMRLSMEHLAEPHGDSCYYRMHELPQIASEVAITARTRNGETLFEDSVEFTAAR